MIVGHYGRQEPPLSLAADAGRGGLDGLLCLLGGGLGLGRLGLLRLLRRLRRPRRLLRRLRREEKNWLRLRKSLSDWSPTEKTDEERIC